MDCISNSTKKSICIEDDWIDSSLIKNFMLDDPLLDWLNLYGKLKKIIPNIEKESNFKNYLQKQTNMFQKLLLSKIDNNEDTVRLSNTLDIKSRIERTYELMKKGTPVIYNAGVINNDLKRFGITYYLIRSDKINDIFNLDLISIDDEIKGCKFNKKWHYRVFDSKFVKLDLKKNREIRNINKSYKFFKSQSIIHNNCLGYMQNYTASESYIIGRNDNDSETIGIINIQNFDKKLVGKIERGFNWLEDLKKNGNNWEVNPPQKIELYPNMCNSDDGIWHSVKKILADNIKELTLLWNIGIKERNIAHKKGKFSWDKIDKNDFDFSDKSKKIVDNIVKINKNENDILYPQKITNKKAIDILSKQKIEYFVDFESINDLQINDFSKRKIGSMTFMIGCLAVIYKENNEKEYIFKDYTVNILKKKEESLIFKEWINFMKDLNKQYCIDFPKIYHWGCAEKVLFSKAFENNFETIPKLNFTDLLLVFKDLPIVIKGVFDFSLKNISKALYSHGLIKNTWEDASIDGREAMVHAWLSNDISKINNQSMKENPLIKEIQKYNFIDCKVVEELTELLRNKI